MRDKTGISCGMLARGAIGNPWLFRELQPDFMKTVDTLVKAGKEIPTFAPNHDQLCTEMRQNFMEMVEFHGEETAVRVSRKIILSYLKGRGYASSWRDQVGRLASVGDYIDFFDRLRQENPASHYINSVTFYDDFIGGQ